VEGGKDCQQFKPARRMEGAPRQNLAMPGTLLGTIEELRNGAGTYIKDGHVYSSVLGFPNRTIDACDSRPMVTITHWRHSTSIGALVPRVGQMVMGRVSRITAGIVNVEISCVEQQVLPVPCSGIIRVEDVFPTEVDHTAVQMTNCFRPGDVIKARIMAMGDSRQYFLSTAAEDLGVAWTRGDDGDILVGYDLLVLMLLGC
jgi:exosome complex component CSL4